MQKNDFLPGGKGYGAARSGHWTERNAVERGKRLRVTELRNTPFFAEAQACRSRRKNAPALIDEL